MLQARNLSSAEYVWDPSAGLITSPLISGPTQVCQDDLLAPLSHSFHLQERNPFLVTPAAENLPDLTRKSDTPKFTPSLGLRKLPQPHQESQGARDDDLRTSSPALLCKLYIWWREKESLTQMCRLFNCQHDGAAVPEYLISISRLKWIWAKLESFEAKRKSSNSQPPPDVKHIYL